MGFQPVDSRGTFSGTVNASYAAALQPNVQAQNYRRADLVVPRSMLHSINWYSMGDEKADQSDSNTAGMVIFTCDVTATTTEQTIARIWLTYDVHLRGFAVN